MLLDLNGDGDADLVNVPYADYAQVWYTPTTPSGDLYYNAYAKCAGDVDGVGSVWLK